jgi:chromosome segregation ATPase
MSDLNQRDENWNVDYELKIAELEKGLRGGRLGLWKIILIRDKTIKQLEKELYCGKDRIHSLEAQVAELKKDVKYWKTMHINGNEFIKKLEKEIDALVKERDLYNKNYLALEAQVDLSTNLLNTSRDDFRELMKQKKALEAKAEQAEKRVKELETLEGNQWGTYAQKILDLETQNARLKEMVEIAKVALERISSDWSIPDHRVPLAKEALQQLSNQGDGK